ncbi:MAG: DUF4440 domain-containing protein [Algicola sp.]|nr:DUF4440 domain-containing protein [Algicola sp.]
MKNLGLLLLVLALVSCKEKSDQQEIQQPEQQRIDIASELAAIEETRTAFQLAVRENRFSDLQKYGTPDVKSLTPSCGAWEPFKELRKNPSGQFHYDSLVMRPVETIIVSDSIAYDFGMSSTYYTDEEGKSVELTATFLAVLKKDKTDGIWKLHREVANTRNLDD